jgi:hypothetical protein
MWILKKIDEPFEVFFKHFDKTGCTWTPLKDDAMQFETKDKAIDFNHDRLYGECEYELNKSCGCNGDCACKENFEKNKKLKKHFEENGSVFE